MKNSRSAHSHCPMHALNLLLKQIYYWALATMLI
jgi:hypothetical protein